MNQAQDPSTLLDPRLTTNATAFAKQFAHATPFRHVVIEDFFAASTAQALLDAFPPFERGNARNEAGELGNKSSVDRVRKLGPVYAQLDDVVQSHGFLDLIGQITGINQLLYDPWYFGGGTHENREGQDLDPHVDFNRHPIEPWHRRLNLIVYLNREWDTAWGGSLELHRDPRAEDDQVISIAPAFNRGVIFETTETSWHGFSRIALPDAKRGFSRRSIALYFYSTDRPAEELANAHSTIYVDRPLPARFRTGLTLTDADMAELKFLLSRRDQHNQRLYRDLTRLTTQLVESNTLLRAGRIGRLAHFGQRALLRLRRS